MFTTLFKSNSRKLPNKHLSEFEKKEALNKTCFVQNLGLEIGLPVNGWNFGASHISQVGMTTFLPVRTFQRQTLIRVQTIGQLGPNILGSMIPYIHQPTSVLNTAQLPNLICGAILEATWWAKELRIAVPTSHARQEGKWAEDSRATGRRYKCMRWIGLGRLY